MFQTITAREGLKFRELAGIPLAMVAEAQTNPEIDVIEVAAALYYIMHKREDPDLTWNSVLDLPINLLMQDLGELQAESEEADGTPLAFDTDDGSPSTIG